MTDNDHPAEAETMKPLIVGEQNPYGGDDEFALYPVPEGCSGHRLCCLIFGMRHKDYLDSFERCNLVQGPWNMRAARERATELHETSLRKMILLGSKVCSAFRVEFRPFASDGITLILPHPSGRNRLWEWPDAVRRAREVITTLVPEIAPLLGKVDADYAAR